MMATVSPRLRSSLRSPMLSARTSANKRAQLQVCQMPKSLWRMAGRSACTRALKMRSLGNVSSASSWPDTVVEALVPVTLQCLPWIGRTAPSWVGAFFVWSFIVGPGAVQLGGGVSGAARSLNFSPRAAAAGTGRWWAAAGPAAGFLAPAPTLATSSGPMLAHGLMAARTGSVSHDRLRAFHRRQAGERDEWPPRRGVSADDGGGAGHGGPGGESRGGACRR